MCFGTMALLVCALVQGKAIAQTNPFLKKGNTLYEQKKYDEAQKSYIDALKRDPNNYATLFNLGNTLYQKKQYDTSRMVMAMTRDKVLNKPGKSALNYNIGNTYMAERKWSDAIDAYKKTLRDNPQDADAKYNLAYAKEMLKKEPQKSGGGKDKEKNQDKKDGKDKQDQQNDPNKKDDNNKSQGNDQKDKQQQDQKEQQGQSQPSKLSQQQAEQLLNALQQEEKKLQDKLKKEKGVPVKLDKDW
jgi:Ca-activated chloride channel homolog